MTELQEKMLYLQTITTIMNEESILRHIATEEAHQSPNMDVEARILYRNIMLTNMKQELISEILNNCEKFLKMLHKLKQIIYENVTLLFNTEN